MVRSKINKDTMTKTAYELSKQPWSAEECEEESKKKVEASMSSDERIAKLRKITEDMLSHKSDYSQSAKALAMAAYKVYYFSIITFSEKSYINRRQRKKQDHLSKRRR